TLKSISKIGPFSEKKAWRRHTGPSALSAPYSTELRVYPGLLVEMFFASFHVAEFNVTPPKQGTPSHMPNSGRVFDLGLLRPMATAPVHRRAMNIRTDAIRYNCRFMPRAHCASHQSDQDLDVATFDTQRIPRHIRDGWETEYFARRNVKPPTV